MQQEQMNRLTSLIKASSTLTLDERSSWLAMLPAMNDKQASELEAILAQSPKPSSPALSTPQPQRVVPAPRPLAAAPTLPPAEVPLSHIANLPMGVNLGAPIAPRPQANKSANSVAPQLPKTQPSASGGFALHLREVLAEKDLPPSHEPPEPLLQAAHVQTQTPTQQSTPVKIFSPISAKQPLVAQQQTSNARPSILPSQLKPISKPPERTAPRIPVIPTSFFNHPPSPPPGLSPKPIAKQPLEPNIPQRREEDVSTFIPEPQAQKPLREVKLETLQDVANLSLNAFHALDAQTLIQALTRLMKKFSYFDVLFALEASPLYEKYLEAGQTVLEENTSFTKYFQSQSNALEVKMTKEDFEGMADVLRQLQLSI